ncbi:MAG TPA: S1 RNA-binding domain-containing protein [Anaerolineae bacterium]|nr:S1 RNA-binding domain-containing protein [Anaerolineae bacterium]
MSEQVAQPTSIKDLQPKMCLEGAITRTELYGAFVDLGLEREGLIHISRLSDQRVKKVSDQVKVGDKVKVWVQSVDPEAGRIALTMVEPAEVEWDELAEGQIRTGKVVRVERYGVFVDLGAERPGLLHVREMGQYVRNPAEVVKLGDTVEVKILKLDRRKRQIDLTMQLEAEDMGATDDEEESILSPMEIAFQQAQAMSNERKSRNRKNKQRQSRRDDMDDIYRRTLQQRD